MRIDFKRKAKKVYSKIDKSNKLVIVKGLKKLEKGLLSADIKHIGYIDGVSVFRFRIGDFRVVFRYINTSEILVHKINKRSRVYQR